MLVAEVRDQSGMLAAGVEVTFILEGHGTLDVQQHVESQVNVTNDGGKASATWWRFPRYSPRRDLRSTVVATAALEDGQIELEDLHASGGREPRRL
jgi:hypothetical protein